jgi:hypothetical protein
MAWVRSATLQLGEDRGDVVGDGLDAEAGAAPRSGGCCGRWPAGPGLPLSTWRGDDRHHLPVPGDLPAILVDEGPLGAHHAELVALRVGQDGPGLGAGLADVHPPSTKGKDAVDLGLLFA